MLPGTTALACLIAAALGGQPAEPPAGPPAVPPTVSQAGPTEAQTQWLRKHAAPLLTVEAGNGFADLEPLRAMIGDARVVGLGEGTHGTREFFQAKHRLLEFLASEMGFSIFSIEANMPEAYALNDYVQGGQGDVNALIGGMYFWTWNTEEVRDMVEWMRAENARRAEAGIAERLQFTGFDMQMQKVALEVVREFLAAHDAEYLGRARGAIALLDDYSPWGRPDAFGCATGRFPVDEGRGRKVIFSGWIKTQAIADGWAGLWWRVDGPTPQFDNMQGRGLRGTTDWTAHSVEIDIPADAEAIYFGLLASGSGRAWFDSLSITLDGQPWTAPEFDLGFEGPQPDGIIAADPMRGAAPASYEAALDEKVFHSGQRSMRIEKVGVEGLPPGDADAIAQSVLDHMTASRDRYIAAAGAAPADWAIQNARVIRQWTGLATDPGGGFAQRDRSMAENAAWILDQNPGAKMVVWAHNAHIQVAEPFMGFHMRQRYGENYVSLAFCSSRGQYYAMPGGGQGYIHALAEPPPDSVEAALETVGEPVLLLDLRGASESDPGSAFLTGEAPFGGTIGARQFDDHYLPTRLRGPYDLLLYVRETTPARQLVTTPAPAR
jgi:erythromycin esterase-like protein